MDLGILTTIIGEQWKQVDGFPYMISSHGRIWSMPRQIEKLFKGNTKYTYYQKGHMIKPKKSNHGYMVVTLQSNGEKKFPPLHRLVGEAFIPNPENLPYINHKDENKENNRVENLEWCDCTYNNTYGSRIKKSYETGIKNGTVKKIVQKDTLGNIIAEFSCLNAAAKETGYSLTSLWNKANGLSKTLLYKECYWEFI